MSAIDRNSVIDPSSVQGSKKLNLGIAFVAGGVAVTVLVVALLLFAQHQDPVFATRYEFIGFVAVASTPTVLFTLISAVYFFSDAHHHFGEARKLLKRQFTQINWEL